MADFSLSAIGGAIGRRPAKAIFPIRGPQGAPGIVIGTLAGAVDAGAMTANTWKTVASASGAGVVTYAAVRQNNTTSQQVSARLLLDGEVVFEQTLATSTSAFQGISVVGMQGNGGLNETEDIAPFSSSAELQIRSTVNRSAGTSCQYVFNFAPVAGGGAGPMSLSQISGARSWTYGDISGMVVAEDTNGLSVDAGDLTADTYKSVLELTGPGVITGLAVANGNTTSQQITVRITLDGEVVLEKAGPTSSESYKGVVLFGYPNNPQLLPKGFLPFNESFKVEVKSTVGRTAGSSIKFGYAGYLT